MSDLSMISNILADYWFNTVIVSSIAIVGLVFAYSIFKQDKSSITNQTISVFFLSMIVWISAAHLGDSKLLANHALLFNRLAYVGLSFIFYCLFVIPFVFPKDTGKLKSSYRYVLLGTAIIMSMVSVSTDKFIKTETIYSWGASNVDGELYYVYLAYALISLLPLFYFFKTYKKLNSNQKNQLRSFLIGLLLFVIFMLFVYVGVKSVIKTDQFYRYGNYSVVFIIAFTTYAMLKHHLFNIKVVLTEISVIIIDIIFAVQVFASPTWLERIVRIGFLLAMIYMSRLLILSTNKEIKQKEELEALAKKLDKANMDLEQLDEAKDNFLSMAAHELNTPIAAIEGYLSMILEEKMGGKIPSKAMVYLKNVFLSSKRLAGLVHDLLNVSRIESNRIHIVYTQEQIEDVINHSISEVKIKADEVGHKLIFEKPAKPLPKTYIDMPRIVEVLINIIGNAIKYTDPPGKIEVKCHADDSKIVVSVEDNGRGIPKDKYNHVFEKFTQVNVLTDQVKGTGLGMFISKNLIELHKGKLWFTSSVDPKDHGTTFYFSLPILKEKPFDPHEGEGALLQTGDKKADTATKPEEGKAEEKPATSAGEKKDDKSEERLESIIEKQTGGKVEDKKPDEADKKLEKTSLAPKLEAEIPTNTKKVEKTTKSTEQDKASEKLIKDAVAEAEKAPTTSLNETMSKLK